MNFKKTIILSFLLFIYTTTKAQNFLEKQLPTPDKLSSFFIGSLLKSTIHYGEKPSNYNGQVLVFNHGYIDLNQLFFTNNTFYKEAFSEGYQVVFVATTRGGGMWENGKLLAESIDIITHKYNINEITLIAHSNGGKAAEVAMFSYDKKDNVKKVFALGTPFWGTYLADISQQWWFNWIWKTTGLNEGSETSTTYYCENIVRPYFDNLQTNQPSKFIILGGSGYKNGHTILAPLTFTSGSILNAVVGTNDGVTSYQSSLRPNANYLFDEGEAIFDHIDLAFGQNVWDYIKPYLNSTETLMEKKITRKTYTPKKVSSNYQIVNSENSYDKIILNKKFTPISLEVFHEKEADEFELFIDESKLTKINHHKNSNETANHKSNYTINNINTTPLLKGNGRFTAFVHFPEGPIMNYENKNKLVNISFNNLNTSHQEIEVNIIVNKTCDLYGKKINTEPMVYNLNYNLTNNNFYLDTSDFEIGVYSIHITGKSPNFTRSLVSGFTIGSLAEKEVIKKLIPAPKIDIELKSTIINDEIVFISNKNNYNTNLNVVVYNLNGHVALKEKVDLTSGNFSIRNNIDKLAKGLYLIVIEKNNLKKTFKVIKK